MRPTQRCILVLTLASATIGVAAAAPPTPADVAASSAAIAPARPAGPSMPMEPGKPAKAAGSEEGGHRRGAPPKRGDAQSKAGARPGKSDFIALGTTTVTGNKELPKVMYIVPWKKSDIGDLSGKPVNSLLDEVLAPVDRDVFRREVTYYQALSTASPQNGAAAAVPAPQGEK